MRTKGKTIVVNEKVDVEFLTMAIGQYGYRPDTGLRKRLESFEVNA